MSNMTNEMLDILIPALALTSGVSFFLWVRHLEGKAKGPTPPPTGK